VDQFVYFFHCSVQKRSAKETWTKSNTSPQICCRTTLRRVNLQLSSFTFILARMISFMSGDIFASLCVFFSSFLFDTDVFVNYCYILFVVLLTPFDYEDKCLAQHWTVHNRRIRRPAACTTPSMNMYRRQTL